MSEDEIAARLKQNLPVAAEPTAPSPPPVNTDEASADVPDRPDALTFFQLSAYLGTPFSPTDAQLESRLEVIWRAGTTLANSKDYWAVTAKINDLQTMLGLQQDPDKIRKLWLWLKLNDQRTNIEDQMRQI